MNSATSTPMAVSSLSLSCFVLLIIINVSLASAKEGFTVELIHPDSPNSPFYNPNATHFDRMKHAVQRSLSRARHVSIQSRVLPDGGAYLMLFKVGRPAFSIPAIADTGSDLIWTNCKPCIGCYAQSVPMFDPARSATYRNVSCRTPACQALPSKMCAGNRCQYHYAYGDQSNVDGVLATETFTFDRSGGGSSAVPGIVFGCSHRSAGTFDQKTAGLVGLGGGPLSLISQLGSSIGRQFSYCLVPLNSQGKSSWLHFGAGPSRRGTKALTTPLIRDPARGTFYFLTLTGIAVTGHSEKITLTPESYPAKYSNRGNIIIDSGTTLTLLFPEVLSQLGKILDERVGLKKVEDSRFDAFYSCYDSSGDLSGVNLPDIIFKFEGGADVRLSPLNTFLEVAEGVLCLAMASPGDIPFQIYGNVAQQNFLVNYDLGRGKLSFAKTDCTRA